MRVLVSNAEYHNALAVIRSLGRAGIDAVACSSSRHAQSFYSKYCGARVLCPSTGDERRFAEFLLGYLRKNRVDVFLPIGYDANLLASKHIEEISEHARVPVAPWESMQVAADKAATMRLAVEVGVPIPEMYKSVGEVQKYPVVVKSVKGSGGVRYISSPEQLPETSATGSLLQEYIPGTGYGFFALFNRGKPRALFMHRRLREYPVTGGVSAAAESVYDPVLERLGLELLSALNWHGVAMAEFKKDSRDGTFKLMELNPKFWGSLDLAIASGVDFPYLAVRMATEGDVDPVLEYRTGVRFRWPLPYDLLHLVAKPNSIRSILVDLFDDNSRSNIAMDDIRPVFIQGAITVGEIITRSVAGRLKYPHGDPRVKR